MFSNPNRFKRMRQTTAAAIAAVLGVTLLVAPSAGAEINEPTDLPTQNAAYGAPDDTAADYYAALLRHTRWTNTVWDEANGRYEFNDYNFAVVLGNAVLLKYGEYDAELAGISYDDLYNRTIATIDYYAAQNKAVNANGIWGTQLFWQSTFQSYFLAAGKVMWDDLSQTTRDNLTTIAVGQSDYTANLNYGRDPLSGSWTTDWPTGKYLGDTAAEEVGVYTQALAPGIAWAPQHPNAATWLEQFNNYARNAAGNPVADTNNPAVIGGAPIDTNTMQTIHDTYVVENHGSFGPHYQSDMWRSGGRNAIHFILNDQPLPEILTQQPNSAELWRTIKMVMSNQGEPLMPMVADREYLYGRDAIPMAFLGQVMRDPDAARAEANLAASLEAYQAYPPFDRLAKFTGEPKYEPEARAEVAISYLLHVAAAESAEGPVVPTPQDEWFERMSGVRDFGDVAGITLQQTKNAWAAAQSKAGFVKFPWVPGHNSWLFDISGGTPFLAPSVSAPVHTRNSNVYTIPRDGFEGTATALTIGQARYIAGQVTLPSGAALYASSGGGIGDGQLTVRNLVLNGLAGQDGVVDYYTAEGVTSDSAPVQRPADPIDAGKFRVDTHDFEPVEARYVRMQGAASGGQYGYSLWSFHVYGADPVSNVDLAAGKEGAASSADGTHTLPRAFDANGGTRWAVASSARSNPNSWIQVDLGEVQPVGGARFAWESAGAAGARYYVQTSIDGENWETQATYDTNPQDSSASRVDEVVLTSDEAPNGFAARYVRMQGIAGDPAYGYSMFNFRAYDAAGVNHAAGKPATASSQDGGFPASNVTDGKSNTRWAVSRDDRPRTDSWIQVDLGAEQQLTRAQFAWEVSAGREYLVQTSLDGETWVDAAHFRYTGDQVVTTNDGWINVEDVAGFVVRGSEHRITVNIDSSQVRSDNQRPNLLRLADVAGGAKSPYLVEQLPADATATADRAYSAVVPTTSSPTALASTLDGYLSVFNLSEEPQTVDVTIPHSGDTVSLFEGAQVVTATESIVTAQLPAASALVLAPRATVPLGSELQAVVIDARTIELASETQTSVTVTNVETETVQEVALAAAATTVEFGAAHAYPIDDLALSTLTYPASVLPEGMTSPGFAVDGDPATAWRPGADGRMVTNLGAEHEFAAVQLTWTGSNSPASVVSVSSDGLTFTDIGTLAGGVSTETLAIPATAQYVAVSTAWAEGDAELTALEVLQTAAPVEPEFTLSALGLARQAFVGDMISGFAARVNDLDGAALRGETVTFTVHGGEFSEGVTTATAVTNAGGLAVAPRFTSAVPGEAYLTAEYHGETITLAPVTFSAPEVADATLTVEPVLVSGKWVLHITVTAGSEPITARVKTRYGSKTLPTIAAGESATLEMKTFVTRLPAGNVTVTVTDSAAQDSVLEESYPAAG